MDDEDLRLVEGYKWYLSTAGYACNITHKKGCTKNDKGRNIGLFMHRLITGARVGQQVDHINGNRLDNRRCNLRIVTHKENTWNTKKRENKTGYTGVKQESENVFCARLSTKVIGYYDTAVKAAQARDLAAIAARGELAVLNFDKGSLPLNVAALPPRNVGNRTSKVVGVSFARKRVAKNKWRVVKNGKHLGWFETEQQATDFLWGVNNEG